MRGARRATTSPDDTTVPYVEKYAEARPAGRADAQHVRAAGRPTRSASASTRRQAPVVVVTMADGCDDPRQIDDAGPARRAGRGRRRRVALHARRPAGRRARRSSGRCPGGPGASLQLVRAGSAPATRRTRSRRTTATSSARSASSPTPGSRSASSWSPRRAGCAARWPRSRRSGSTGTLGESQLQAAAVAAQLPPLVPLRIRPQLTVDAARAQRERSPASRTRADARTSTTSDAVSSKVLVTGSAGFIGGYVVEELLAPRPRGGRHRQLLEVRPGRAVATTTTPATASSRATRATSTLMTELLADCDHFIAGAAMIGGISYFHAYAYDLLATNERIMAAVVRRGDRGAPRRPAAEGHLPVARRWCSSRPTHWPSKEGDEREIPPPLSSYGFQKLAVEYFAQGRLGPVPAAVHDRAPVQLRRRRRGPRARRGRGAVAAT